jgi:protein ImuA
MVVSADFPESRPVENRSAEIEALRANLCRMTHSIQVESRRRESLSTGVSVLDDILPERGLARGTLSEWISEEPGSGVSSLAMNVAGESQADGPLIVVDRSRHFHVPAMALAGVNLNNTIFVRPQSRGDELWAMEQSLRCPGVGAVLCRIDFLKSLEFRRLQLAAASGTAIGVLIRTSTEKSQTGWADVRLLVSPRPSLPGQFQRRLAVRCIYAKGNFSDRSVDLTLCEKTGELRGTFQ